MIYHADIPNGDYIESLTVEADSSEGAHILASAYIFKAFGETQAPGFVNAWASLSVPVKTGIIHFAHKRDEDNDY